MKLPISHKESDLKSKILQTLKIAESEILTYEIRKKSIDARKKPELFWVYSVDVTLKQEEKVLRKLHNPSVISVKEKTYQYPQKGNIILQNRPYIIGAGPAGLFCAFLLTEMGYKPIVVERGKSVEARKQDVEDFWKTGVLDTKSNVQFGEGGAGAFSDGKLNTLVKDPVGRNRLVLETFVKYGAPVDILYDAKPHIGTDVLEQILISMRNDLLSKGCEFWFEALAEDFYFENGKITGVRINGDDYSTDVLVLAPGHSARDTFRCLYEKKLDMEAKQFAVGFRVEHPQKMINESQYGKEWANRLPAAPYKVTSNFPNGRGVYSFCMCPGGYVVNSSSGERQTVVNGMSYSKRDGANANSAIIVSVGPEDFGSDDALAGVLYQEKLEAACYELGKGKIPQQLFGDYCTNQLSKDYGEYVSTTCGESCFANLRGLLSPEMEDAFIKGMNHFGKIIEGFNRPDAIMSGIESRTSSPIRIKRNELYESSVRGLYPCGEGAGYAGGIMSAAMDGIKVAEAIVKEYSVWECEE